MRHIVNAIEGSDEVKTRITGQGLNDDIVESDIAYARLNFVGFSQGQGMLGNVIAVER